MYFRCPKCSRLQPQIKSRENCCVYCFPVDGKSPILIEEDIMIVLKEDLLLLLSLIPDWVKIVPKGLDCTFYGTGTYEGDLEIKERIDKIRQKLEDE